MKHLLGIGIIMVMLIIQAAKVDSIKVRTEAEENRILQIWYRLPSSKPHGIMVLFGGRNWSGEKTINTYCFNKLADKHKLILISPSFKNDEYWHPEKWSGKALLKAVSLVQKKYKIAPERKLLYYGYSAGGQCSNLFYAWKPEIVKAWGVHACGVWYKPDKQIKVPAPGLITCGTKDNQRHFITQNFIYNARENGANLIWRTYPVGHGLDKMVLKLAEVFFDGVLSGGKAQYTGDDQTMKYYPAASSRARNIDVEYRNNLINESTAKLWAGN